MVCGHHDNGLWLSSLSWLFHPSLFTGSMKVSNNTCVDLLHTQFLIGLYVCVCRLLVPQLRRAAARMAGLETPVQSLAGDQEMEGERDSGGESKELSEVSEATESTDVKDSSSDSQ